MSPPFIFCLRKSSSSRFTGRGLGPIVFPRSFKTATTSMSFSINCGLWHRIPSAGPGLGLHNSYPMVMSSSNRAMKPYHTDLKAAKFSTWNTWSLPSSIRRKQINQYFHLGHISRIFDDLLFRGLLKKRLVLRWVEPSTGKPEWLSRTTLISDVKRGPCALIEVVKSPAHGPWTVPTIQEYLEALLHEMTKVFFLMPENCASFARSKDQAATGGLSGQEVSAGKLWREMELDANRKLKGFPRLWQLIPCRR